MRILVDLDGIVTDTLPAWLDRIYELTGTRAHPRDITKWNLNENPALAKVDPKVLFGILNEEGFNLKLRQMADACKFLKRLNDAGHDVHLLTARYGTRCMPETVQWVEEMMPWFNVKKKLGFFYDKHRITADMLIDDKAETLIEYHNEFPNAHLVTIDYPYNQHAPAATKRVPKEGYEWELIESHINDLSNNR